MRATISPEGPRKSRLVIIVSHPIQHFCPLYAAVARAERIDLTVLFASRSGYDSYRDREFGVTVRWGEKLLDGFKSQFLPGAEGRADLSRSLDCPELGEILTNLMPDAVLVYGFFHRISRRAIRWARENHKGVLYLSDSELLFPRGVFTRLRKAILVPHLLRTVDVFLTVGDQNEAYYRRYGASPSRFVRCPFPIDEPAFDLAWSRRAEIRSTVRAEYGLDLGDVVVLAVGKLTERKRFIDVVRAVCRVSTDLPNQHVRLLIAGDGPERCRMEAAVPVDSRGSVVWAGFVSPEKLVAIYHASDILVHPSAADPHPLVTVEAGAAGLPIIVSDRVGSAGPSDDVRPGLNGERFAVGDVDCLVRIIKRLVEDAEQRIRYGKASREIYLQRRMASSVNGIETGVREAIRVRSTTARMKRAASV